MALTTLICPQCGANIKLDDDREYGFCEFCGNKIQLKEIVEHHHVIDNSKQTDNRRIVADRAFSAGNYDEAAKYYTLILEDKHDDVDALARKGICSVYNSSVTNVNEKEFITYVDAAIEESAKNVDELLAFRSNLDDDIMHLMTHYVTQYGPSADLYASVNDCINKVNIWVGIFNVLVVGIRRLYLEANLEKALPMAIKFCDKTIKKSLKYQYTEQVRNKNGNLEDVQRVGVHAVPVDLLNTIANQRKVFAEAYNTLPSRQKVTTELENNIADAKQAVEEAEAQLKEYKESNAQFKTGFLALFNGKQKNDPEYPVFKEKMEELKSSLGQKKKNLKECEGKLANHRKTFM